MVTYAGCDSFRWHYTEYSPNMCWWVVWLHLGQEHHCSTLKCVVAPCTLWPAMCIFLTNGEICHCLRVHFNVIYRTIIQCTIYEYAGPSILALWKAEVQNNHLKAHPLYSIAHRQYLTLSSALSFSSLLQVSHWYC